MSSLPQQLISEAEYLNTSYRPDCDFVDGFLLERNVGIPSHSRLQTLVTIFLGEREREWRIRVLTECRLKVRNGRYRIPDVMVLSADVPYPELAVEQAPLLCIEVVSPRDQMADLAVRASDYLALGVPATWIVDPKKKNRGYIPSAAPSSR